MVDFDLASEIQRAHARIAPHVRRTPIERSSWLSSQTGADVYCKLENHQLTGSFKIRGALNRVLATPSRERLRGFVAASTGNHGLAVSYATHRVDAPATIFLPTSAEPGKIRRLEATGVEVVVEGRDCVESEAAARHRADATGATYISPYNDPLIIAGQGTLGLELAHQVASLDAVFVALGGGGLISGVAAHFAAERIGAEIVACSPSRSAVMMQSVAAGRILDLPSEPTISDGTAGGVEVGAITFDLCQRLVDRYVAVEEAAIVRALCAFVEHHHSLIEGAAAVPVAALLASARQLSGRRVGVVLCGANIALGRLKEALGTLPVQPGTDRRAGDS